MNKTGIIVTGGTIEDTFALEWLSKVQPEILIGVDRGLEFLYRHQIEPTHIVGDFDSANQDIVAYYKRETQVPIREFNPVKDASDTEIAVRLAIELGVEKLWILGGTGSRLDHVLANIQVLCIAQAAGVDAYIVDPYNQISLIRSGCRITKASAFGSYFSLFPLGGEVKGLTITGAKYPLENHTLRPENSLCVSNQIAGEEVKITFSEGTVVLMETRDSR